MTAASGDTQQSGSALEPTYLYAAQTLLAPCKHLFAAIVRGLSLLQHVPSTEEHEFLGPAGAAPHHAAVFAPNTFRRRTSKFWLRPEHLLKVKLAIAQHLPVLDPTAATEAQLAKLASQGETLSADLVSNWQPSMINSAYYDTATYDVYMSRLVRDDGATLVRARLYGDDAAAPGALFLERKCHRDFWTGEWSYKDREALTRVCLSSSVPSCLWGLGTCDMRRVCVAGRASRVHGERHDTCVRAVSARRCVLPGGPCLSDGERSRAKRAHAVPAYRLPASIAAQHPRLGR